MFIKIEKKITQNITKLVASAEEDCERIKEKELFRLLTYTHVSGTTIR